jgi:hypothetical protein
MRKVLITLTCVLLYAVNAFGRDIFDKDGTVRQQGSPAPDDSVLSDADYQDPMANNPNAPAPATPPAATPAPSSPSDKNNELGVLEKVERLIAEDALEVSEKRNVAGFDIAGFMLAMTPSDVREKSEDMEYRIVKEEYKIPKLIRYNYDFLCRENGVYGPEAIESCITGYGRNNNTLYIAKHILKRAKTGEEIEVSYTSNYTGNAAYKILYKNNANKKLGVGENFEYHRREKIRTFWAMILTKYLGPNVAPNIWIEDPTNFSSPKLQASYGVLILSHDDLKKFDEEEVAKAAKETFEGVDYYF